MNDEHVEQYEPSVLDDMRENPPSDRAGWVALSLRIFADLEDAKSELADAKRAAYVNGQYLNRADFKALSEEVVDLKVAHQHALLAASACPK